MNIHNRYQIFSYYLQNIFNHNLNQIIMAHTNHYYTQRINNMCIELRALEFNGELRLSIVDVENNLHSTVDLTELEQNEFIIAILRRRGMNAMFYPLSETLQGLTTDEPISVLNNLKIN